MNSQFKVYSRQENANSTVYYKEEKNLINVKVFSDATKSKLIQLLFVSDPQLLQIVFPQ